MSAPNERQARAVPPAELFKAIADETRLRILGLLLHAGESLCVCEMVDALELPQYQVSRQLSILKRAEIVSVRKSGTWAYYKINADNEAFTAISKPMQELLKDEVFIADRVRLDRRLSLRERGRCVVGFGDEQPAVGAGWAPTEATR